MSYLFPTYKRWEVEPAHAKGSYITGVDGKVYLDFTSGIGVCNLGHCHPEVEQAVVEQLKKFWHVSNLFPQSIQEKAAKLLVEASGLDLVFFANSGAEANEAAIKLARKATGRSKVISFTNSFHGRTFGSMAATGQDKIKQGFGPMLETFTHLPFNDTESLLQEIGKDTAAVILEVIQGEGGIHAADVDFLANIQKACKETGALVIIDEIQTGVGRTGKPFAFQHFNLKPDIITVAKGLGSGFPIGAVIGKGNLQDAFGPGSHGSTFGGNPMAVSAAIATMELIFEGAFLNESASMGEYLFEQITTKLGELDGVKEVRGLGLMLGIEISANIAEVLSTLRSKGLIALPAGENVIRLLPPLNITKAEVDQAVDLLEKTLSHITSATV
ncbi:acetylornithine aminotransferase apoenzyme [Mesobacillus persicus]|uniref:Acetylornithine aminotransferase n=1 Tax=Mesobacillus persicus TaxID=930146 RepID=A0A1H8E6X3_9BACI|nr:acetylornithine transaminase [Mesobacillus persicus]SEN14547.1 acetylornithine aminotransferase apoenzyme [Mesobacillus persicus]